ASVDLNTAWELLGHLDLKMTLRYAHLAPEHKSVTVNLIGFKLHAYWLHGYTRNQKTVAVTKVYWLVNRY
ncbi:hypothetical protein, partial [Vibrio genomosp. F10]|uniref:hypothetical protein n=1 Tax=Vibrio genomosp. F10 TaxID=723171 RepID=UPI003CF5609F